MFVFAKWMMVNSRSETEKKMAILRKKAEKGRVLDLAKRNRTNSMMTTRRKRREDLEKSTQH